MLRRACICKPLWTQTRDIQVVVLKDMIQYIIPVGPEKLGKPLGICVKEDYITVKFAENPPKNTK